MDELKQLFEKLLQLIDNGKFFREPMKWLYILNGVIPFIFPFIFLWFIIDQHHMFRYLEGWPLYTAVIGAAMVFIWLMFIAYFSYIFWIHRKNQINTTVKIGDNIIVIPVLAHFFQCWGEFYGLYIAIVPPVSWLMFWVAALLSGFKAFGEFTEFGDMLIYVLLVQLATIVICVLVGYFIVLFAHFLGEHLRIKAQMANDLRDVSDIHRAAAMPENDPAGNIQLTNSLTSNNGNNGYNQD